MTSILYQATKVKADGVDFFNFALDPPLKVMASYTIDEIKDISSFPGTIYSFWKKDDDFKHYIRMINGNAVIEILGNSQLTNAFIAFDIHAVATFIGEDCNVWAISQEDFDRIVNIPDEDWSDSWGWWRYAVGSNIHNYPMHTFTVNGKPMIGFYDEDRLKSHIELLTEDGEMTAEEAEQDYFTQKYSGLRSYLCDVIGASTESNVCAVATDIATLNGLTLGALFQNYGDK